MLRILLLFLSLIPLSRLSGQNFVGAGNLYPLTIDGNKYVVSGFIPFSNLTDEEIYANALLWTVESICPKGQEGITARDVKAKNFSCDLILSSLAGSGLENIYHCRATFRVKDNKMIY